MGLEHLGGTSTQRDNHVGHKGTEIEVLIDTELYIISVRFVQSRTSNHSLQKVSFRWEYKLEMTLPCKNLGLQLSCMSLHLIAVFIYTTKEVSSAMHV